MSMRKKTEILKSFEDLGKAYSTFGPGLLSGNTQKEPAFSSGALTISVPLEPRFGKTSVKALEVSFPKGTKKGILNLTWQLLHGKKFPAYGVYLIFSVLERYKVITSLSQRLFNILVIVNNLNRTRVRRAGEILWNTNYSGLRVLCESHPELSDYYKSCTCYFNSIEDFPRSKREFDPDSYSLREIKIHQMPSPSPPRIGVGYKDHGSLAPQGSEYDPSEITAFSEPDRYKCWDMFLNNFRDFLRTNGLQLQ